MNAYEIFIDNPSGDLPLIDRGRDFNVWGRLKGRIEEDMRLSVELFDAQGHLLRQASSHKKKDKSLFTDFAGLTSYKESLDPHKEKLKDFGFPELLVKDLKDPYASLNDATIKCFYDDASFKAVIVSGTDRSHGRIFDTGMDLTDGSGHPYTCLEKGDYVLRASLYDGQGKLCAECEKPIRIDVRKEAVIVRFNPAKHKERMIDWCKRNSLTIVNDTLPGYLEAYLGTWYYHMGVLPYYRSNDIAVYQDAKVSMFVYLCDPTSTSYATELAYLQTKGQVGNEDLFKAYRYDIGEAYLGQDKPYARTGKIEEFHEDLHLYRIDRVSEDVKENVFDLSEKGIRDVFYDTEHIKVRAGDRVAFCGVVRPLQLKSEDVVLNDDNTYTLNHEVKYIRYLIDDGESVREIKKELLIERIDGSSIGTSVYEFYHIFEFKEEDRGKKIVFSLEIWNDLERMSPQIVRTEAEVL